MRFAIGLPTIDGFADVRVLVELAQEAEKAGWDAVFLWDITGSTGTDPSPAVDTWIAMAAIATVTERIRFGPTVTPLARRRPAKVARETATLDRLSDGRMILGAGLGAFPHEEFEALGEDPDPLVRAEKLDEALDIIAGLWSGEPFSHSGKHFTVRASAYVPTPVQRPRIPVWIGGYWPHKSPARRAARWDGMFPVGDWPDAYLAPEDYLEIRRFIASHRTDEAPFDLMAQGTASGEEPPLTPEVLRDYEEAGVTWWCAQGNSPEKLGETIRRGPPRL